MIMHVQAPKQKCVQGQSGLRRQSVSFMEAKLPRGYKMICKLGLDLLATVG